MDWGIPNKLAYASSLAAAVGFVALGRNDLVSAVCLGNSQRSLGRLRGRGRALDLLKFLDNVPSSGELDLEAALRNLLFGELSGGRAGGQAIVFSDLLVPLDAFSRSLEYLLAGQLDISVVHLLSPQELEPEPGGDYAFIDAESGNQVQVGLSLSAIGGYLRRLEAWQEDVAAVCMQRGVRYVRARTDEPLEAVMLTRLRESLILA
jgi:uncharacterized protein (DUF58 family)